MEAQGASEEILKTLDRLHTAHKTGDVEAILDCFTDKPQGVSNGIPRTQSELRAHIVSVADAYKMLEVDMTRLQITVDLSAGNFWRHNPEGEVITSGPEATVEPIIYRTPLNETPAIGPHGSIQNPCESDELFMAYNLVKEADGNWRIVHDQVIPDPDGEAYLTRDLLADAGRVLDNQTMVWLRKIDAPLDIVWDAVSTSEGIRRWWLGRDETFEIEPWVGGTFKHHWTSEIHEIKELELIDFKEFRIGLRPDGDGTLLTFMVFTMNGDEWRAFWRAQYSSLYYVGFGGLDPWSASGWHHIIDRLEQILTDRPLEYCLNDSEFSWLPDSRLNHFYLVHLQDLHPLEALSRRVPMQADWQAMLEGHARSEEVMDPGARKDSAYHKLQIKIVTHPGVSVLVIEREVDQDDDGRMFEVQRQVTDIVQTVSLHIERHHGTPAGDPFVRVLSKNDRTVRFQAGFPVSEDIPAQNLIVRSTLPGGKLITACNDDPVDPVVRAQTWWPWLITYAEDRDYPVNTEWENTGGWQVFLDGTESGLGYRLCLPLNTTD